jgi:HEAT repeats/Putative zinc-finger
MTCEQAQERIALAVYGELPDDERHALTLHLAHCEACGAEYEAVNGLRKAMSLHPIEDPSANLVARARLRLEAALDEVPQGSWMLRMLRRLRLDLMRLRSAPVMASALLVLGVAAGSYGGYKLGRHQHHQEQAELILQELPMQPANANPSQAVVAGAPGNAPDDTLAIDPLAAKIANVSQILHDPDSSTVEVSFNRLVPETIEGSINDPEIRRLLLLGVQNPQSPMVRDDSVNLLAGQCRAGHCNDGPVRRALMEALRYDADPGVRMNALAGLQPYIADDRRVRDAVLDAVLHDSDPIVRTQAIQLIAPIEADSSVRQVLHTLAAQDDDAAIRTVSEQMLEQGPQIQ